MVNLHNIGYRYPCSPSRSLNNINFTADKGTINVITGASGCGKSTLGRLLCGLVPHYYKGELTGSATIAGVEVRESSPAKLAYMVGFLPQRVENGFFSLNVGEELRIIPQERGQSEELTHQKIAQVASKLGIEAILEDNLMQLSEGQKQKVALAALLIGGCRLLVLDEPSANLDEQSVINLAAILNDLKAEGYCIIILDHRLSWLRHVADYVAIMSDGCIKEHGAYSILRDQSIRHHYALRSYDCMEQSLNEVREIGPSEHGPFSLKNLCFSYDKKGSDLFCHYSVTLPQAVIGLTGRNGVGKTALARLLVGLEKPQSGEVAYGNKRMTRSKLAQGASMVLQNMDHQLHYKTVGEEINNSYKKRVKEGCVSILDDFNLGHLINRHPQSLSGGEKQRLAVASAMTRGGRIVVLDEPSSGLDEKNMDCIAQNIKKAHQRGITILVISHDRDLIDRCAHYRIIIG